VVEEIYTSDSETISSCGYNHRSLITQKDKLRRPLFNPNCNIIADLHCVKQDSKSPLTKKKMTISKLTYRYKHRKCQNNGLKYNLEVH